MDNFIQIVLGGVSVLVPVMGFLFSRIIKKYDDDIKNLKDRVHDHNDRLIAIEVRHERDN